MASSDTKINISSRAFTQIGGNPISAFDGGSVEARLAEEFYATTFHEMLTSNHWGFAQKFATLPSSGEAEDRYEFAYPLPSDFLSMRGLEPPADWEIRGSDIVTDVVAPIVLDYTRLVTEQDCPAYFVAALTDELSAKFAFPITRQTAIADYWVKRASSKLGDSRYTDSIQFPPKAPAALDELIAARF